MKKLAYDFAGYLISNVIPRTSIGTGVWPVRATERTQ